MLLLAKEARASARACPTRPASNFKEPAMVGAICMTCSIDNTSCSIPQSASPAASNCRLAKSPFTNIGDLQLLELALGAIKGGIACRLGVQHLCLVSTCGSDECGRTCMPNAAAVCKAVSDTSEAAVNKAVAVIE